MSEEQKFAGVGVGLRSVHYSHLLEKPATSVEWLEAISENFMDSEGRPLRILEFVRENFPVGLHGVSMSIGSAEGVDADYIKRLKHLVDHIEPFIVTDHLCWTRTSQGSLHDLLPLPYTEECLEIITENLDRVQNGLARKIALENPSPYLSFKHNEMTEWEFLAALAQKSGCGVLLDVNNVYVSATNLNFDAKTYIDAIPTEAVMQIHLGGYSDMGSFLFDTHSRAVWDDVWELYAYTVERISGVPVLIEWDEDIPEFSRLEDEAKRARDIRTQMAASLIATASFTDTTSFTDTASSTATASSSATASKIVQA